MKNVMEWHKKPENCSIYSFWYGILETVNSHLRHGLSHKDYRHCDIRLQGHSNLFLKIEICKNFKYMAGTSVCV